MNTKNCNTHDFLLLQVDYWLGAIGHSLCYGTILVKIVRVYYIFDNPSLRKKVSYKTQLVKPLILNTHTPVAVLQVKILVYI